MNSPEVKSTDLKHRGGLQIYERGIETPRRVILYYDDCIGKYKVKTYLAGREVTNESYRGCVAARKSYRRHKKYFCNRVIKK